MEGNITRKSRTGKGKSYNFNGTAGKFKQCSKSKHLIKQR